MVTGHERVGTLPLRGHTNFTISGNPRRPSQNPHPSDRIPESHCTRLDWICDGVDGLAGHTRKPVAMTRGGWRRPGGIVSAALGASVLLALTSASPALAQQRGEIRVKVVGLRSDQGELRFGLYDRKETFATKDGPVLAGGRRIRHGQCELVLPDLPYGAYAIIVGHDVNGDGKINENPFSSELKGISNYSGKVLWFPDFDKARFRLDQASVTVEIRVY